MCCRPDVASCEACVSNQQHPRWPREILHRRRPGLVSVVDVHDHVVLREAANAQLRGQLRREEHALEMETEEMGVQHRWTVPVKSMLLARRRLLSSAGASRGRRMAGRSERRSWRAGTMRRSPYRRTAGQCVTLLVLWEGGCTFWLYFCRCTSGAVCSRDGSMCPEGQSGAGPFIRHLAWPSGHPHVRS